MPHSDMFFTILNLEGTVRQKPCFMANAYFSPVFCHFKVVVRNGPVQTQTWRSSPPPTVSIYMANAYT